MSFGRFPNKWVMERDLRTFLAGARPGENLAALKVYLLIAAYAGLRHKNSGAVILRDGGHIASLATNGQLGYQNSRRTRTDRKDTYKAVKCISNHGR